MQALFILIGLGLLYAATGYIIYGGQYVLALFMDIDRLSLYEAFDVGDKILIVLIITAVIASILNHFGIIDLSSLKPNKGGKNEQHTV